MARMSITLYFAPGTRATRIAFLLDELGVPWQKVTLDLSQREHKTRGCGNEGSRQDVHGVLPRLR